MMSEIPWRSLIFPQIFNFAVFIGVLAYFTRKPIKELLEKKVSAFSAAREQAEGAKLAAERRHSEAELKLRELEQSENHAIDTAERESEELRIKTINEAKKTAERQALEAQEIAQYEFERAANMLRLEIVNEATQYASTLLKSRTDKNLRAKLNDEFINKVKAT